ncbi:MAG: XdhC family protein [Rhodospirillaceae bacterium]|nr:XdhC family protein [Rhodospirillaceae bacterium]
MHNVDADPLDRLAEWHAAGKKTALATVIKTWGSSPRPVGSHLAVSEDGDFAGSVSGGCIEGSVIEAALATIASGQPVQLEFGVTNDMAWEVGIACGGKVQVYVESIS